MASWGNKTIYSGANLFARDIQAQNTNFASANIGFTFQQALANTWNLNLHAFYERRLGNKFKSLAAFNDYPGSFEQAFNTSQNFLRIGVDLNYESPINARGIGYFASVGVDYEMSLGGSEKYKAYGGDIKGGIRF